MHRERIPSPDQELFAVGLVLYEALTGQRAYEPLQMLHTKQRPFAAHTFTV